MEFCRLVLLLETVGSMGIRKPAASTSTA